MSRDITSAVDTALDGAVLRPVVLFHAEFPSGDFRAWSGLHELVYDGNTYSGSGDLLKFGGVTETGDLQETGVALTLSGISSSLRNVVLDEDYQRAAATISLLMLDEDHLPISDAIPVYSGFVDVVEFSDDGDELLLDVRLENDMALFGKRFPRRYTNASQQDLYSGDLFFEYIESLVDKDLPWGS